MALVLLLALVLIVAFFVRSTWTPAIGESVAVSLFLGAVLLLVGLLYAMLPPQRDL
jgi:hypothetical protein